MLLLSRKSGFYGISGAYGMLDLTDGIVGADGTEGALARSLSEGVIGRNLTLFLSGLSSGLSIGFGISASDS